MKNKTTRTENFMPTSQTAPRETCFASIPLSSFLVLLIAFLTFLAILLPPASRAPYYYDHVTHFELSQQIPSNPFAALSLNRKDNRRHPLFLYILFVESYFFGPSRAGYFIVLFLFHFLNSLLIFKLSQSLGLNRLAGTLGSLLFLVTSSHYQAIIQDQSAPRILCFFFFLLATLSWTDYLQHRSIFSLLKTNLFQILALLNEEDAIVFPLMAFFFIFLFISEQKEKKRILLHSWPWLVILNGITSFFLLNSFFYSPSTNDRISSFGIGFIVRKLVSLAKMFILPLFIPDKGFWPFAGHLENVFRLGPMFIFSFSILLYLFKQKKIRILFSGIPGHTTLIAFGWIAITILPYLPHPLTFEHVSRYMYFPMVGFSFLFGTIVARFFQTMWNLNLKSGLIIGFIAISYIFILNLYNNSYHFQRYENYMKIHPEQDYSKEVRQILSAKTLLANQ